MKPLSELNLQRIVPDDDSPSAFSPWPTLIYKGVLSPRDDLVDPTAFEYRFDAHGWPSAWRSGLFAFDHFHSQAHETLGVFRGRARLLLGGNKECLVETGDLLVLPAGTGHQCVSAENGFCVVGAYPEGQSVDTCKPGDLGEAQAREFARCVSVPTLDPWFGADGPLPQLWT